MEQKTKKNKKLLKFVKALRKHELQTEFCKLANTKPSYLEQIYGGYRSPSPSLAKNLYDSAEKLREKHVGTDLPVLELYHIRPDIWTPQVA